MFSKAILTSTLIAAVSAHQNFHQFWVNDVTAGYQAGIRMPPSNSPVEDVTSNDIVCNVGGSKVPSGVDTIPANEGDTIKVQWDQSGHPGPITHMLFGPVADASAATGLDGSWFKIDELNAVDGKWANEIMGENNMTHEFKLPAGLPSGEYLLRSEMLALHGAQTVGGAQFYIGCAQLKITGTGSEGACGPTIKLPGAYKAEDPNIYIPNVYNGFDISSYEAPGGPVASCGAGSGSGSAPAPAPSSNSTAPASSSAAAAAPSSAAPVPTSAVEAPSTNATVPAAPSASAPASSVVAVPSSSAVATSSALPTLVPSATQNSTSVAAPTSTGSLGPAKKFYQCGGKAWTGTTLCEQGTTCKQQNDYYSQCI